MDVFYTLLNLLSFLLIILYILKHKRNKSLGEKSTESIPNLPFLALIESLYQLAKIKSVEDVWKILIFLSDYSPKLVKIWLGAKSMVMVTDPIYIEMVLSNPMASEKDPVYKVFQEAASGIFTQNGSTWKSLRKPLNKLMHTVIAENPVDIFFHNAEKLSKKIDQKVNKGIFDVQELVSYCAIDVICATHGGVPGLDENMEEKRILPIVLKRGLEIAFKRAAKPQYSFDMIFYLTKEGKEFKNLFKDLHALSKTLITRRMGILSGNSNDEMKIESYTDIIIKVGKEEGLTIEEMANWNTDFLVAGYGSTAVTVSSLIVFLALHPECQEKVYEEQVRIFGNSDRAPTLGDLKEMDYLNMVFKETLRNVGPPGIVRKISADIKLDNYVLTKGTSVYLAFYKMHQQLQYWEHPSKFYPEHFLPENKAKRPKKCFLPFSCGPRMCPGEMYANLLTKTILSVLCRKFIFKSHLKFEEIQYKYYLLLEFANGYPVEARKRISS